MNDAIKKYLDKHELSPKKSLGQNFLTDEKALDKIIAAAELTSEDKVLEIGPGTGVLTERLIQQAGKVIAIEKDDKLAAYLEASMKSRPEVSDKITIVHDDILEIHLPKLIEEQNFQEYKVVANIPYYITGQIVRMLLETKYPPQMMVLLVQKEVAERICARAGDMSILAVSVQYYGTPELIAEVPKESFHPAPEVDSAILKITLQKKFSPEDKEFFRLVKIGFSSRRKTLVNNLSSGLRLTKEQVSELLQKAEIPTSARAQELSEEDWKKLAAVCDSK